jgi:hypothetical protein
VSRETRKGLKLAVVMPLAGIACSLKECYRLASNQQLFIDKFLNAANDVQGQDYLGCAGGFTPAWLRVSSLSNRRLSVLRLSTASRSSMPCE